ncbi:MAG: folylpolyglutamate synthase/dihydrofolate synthase family protein [Rikenellaceae bacterium]
MSNSAIDFLLSIPMFQQIGAAALNPSLDKITEIDTFLGHPHREFKTIHVAGTNGKGSVSHILCSVLMAAGYKVGLYTSPHLKAFNERIRINGEEVETAFIEDFVSRSRDLIEELKPSFFEVTTALAFDYFRAQKVDITVIEVGLGGSFDATNIINPILSVITNISKDHTSILGNTLAEIAEQKAGIIKQNVPVVLGESDSQILPVFERISKEKGSSLTVADSCFSVTDSRVMSNCRFFEISSNEGEKLSLICELTGEAQKKNILTICAAYEVLKGELNLTLSDLQRGVEKCSTATNLKGRWQTLSTTPLTICDTAHNEAGIREVVKQLSEIQYNKLYIVLGMVADKDINSVLALFPKEAYYIFTKAQISRALDEGELMKLANNHGLTGESCGDTGSAFARAKELATVGDMIFIGGSNFVVSEFML